MLLTVGEFCDRARRGMPALVHELQERTGRYGEAEADAWENSFGLVAQVLRRTKLHDAHLHLGPPPSLSLEYRLPASSSWCDTVLLGRGGGRSTAVMMELKDWITTGDAPGPRAGLVTHQGKLTLHPAEQLRGYVEYCRRFHSTVHDAQAQVAGCVFFTRAREASAYLQAPHQELTHEFPVFTADADDLTLHLPRHLEALIDQPDPDFASAFEVGQYRQDRNFIRQVAAVIENPENEEFVLLDHQRLGFECCLEAIDRALASTSGKCVILIQGPPGSGKSVLALNLWARLAGDPRIGDNVVFTTTSAAHKANWKTLFDRVAGHPAGRGIVVPANEYNPGLTPIWVKAMRKQGHAMAVSQWKGNLDAFTRAGKPTRIADDQIGVSIVDEAHALIDPTAPGKEGVPPSGWTMHAGPQAWHVMRASRVSIFLMDSEQSYRDNETTTPAAIRHWAAEQGIRDVEAVSLEDAQYRCAGSKEYLEWLDDLLLIRRSDRARTNWRRRDNQGPFEFEVVQDPQELEDRLRRRIATGASARLVASYSRPWKTKKLADPHAAGLTERDLELTYLRDGEARTWSRIWNVAPDQDYTMWVQAPSDSAMGRDPLCEVGCPYVVRGFDYDYLGLLWMKDLCWRDGGWEVDLKHVHESAWKKSIAASRNGGPDSQATIDLVNRLLRGYRVLLSRAIRGVYVWFEDAETRAFVERSLEPR